MYTQYLKIKKTIRLVVVCVVVLSFVLPLQPAQAAGAEQLVLRNLINLHASLVNFLAYLPGRFEQLGARVITSGQTTPSEESLKATCAYEKAVVLEVPPAGSSNDDGAMVRAIFASTTKMQSVANSAAVVIRFPKSQTYTLSDNPDRYDALAIKPETYNHRMKCVFVEGNGSTLLVSPLSNTLYVGFCDNCLIKDLKLSTTLPTYAEGRVIAKNSTTMTLDIQLSADSPVATFSEDQLSQAVIGKNHRNLNLKTYEFGSLRNNLKHVSSTTTRPHMEIKSVALLSSAEKIVRVTLDPAFWWTKNTIESAVLNQSIATIQIPFANEMRRQHLESIIEKTPKQFANYTDGFIAGNPTGAIYAEANNQLVFKNITINESPGLGMMLRANDGPMLVDGLKIIPPEGRRTLSVTAGGVRVLNNAVGPIIVNSILDSAGDDFVNYSTCPIWAEEISSDRMTAVLQSCRSERTKIQSGSIFALYDGVDGTLLGNYTVATSSFVAGRRYSVVFKQPLPSALKLKGSPMPDQFVNNRWSNQNGLISGNTFIGSIRNGIIMRSGATITNNKFIGLGGSALIIERNNLIEQQPPRGESGSIGPVAFSANTIVQSGGMLSFAEVGSREYKTLYGKLSIHDNVVYEPYHDQRGAVIEDGQHHYGLQIDSSGNTIFVPQGALSQNLSSLVNMPAFTGMNIISVPTSTLQTSIAEVIAPIKLSGLKAIQDKYGIVTKIAPTDPVE